MQVQIKDIKSGRTFELGVTHGDVTGVVKQKLAASEGIPVEQQRLIHGGKTLADSQTLAQAGVTKGATLHLVLRLKASLTLSVRTMAGNTTTFEVQPAATAGHVKSVVEQLTDLAAEQHTLNFDGRLADEAVLRDHGIKSGSTLRLVRTPFVLQAPLPGAAGSSGGADRTEASQERDRARVCGDMGTLYARCGGIFGIAGFVDRCMDKWMADATLNANLAVATWHDRAQRCGFKFLVTQLMGFLAGGPQRYTGLSMALAHKHLNIVPAEWTCFMDVFHEVCSEFGLPQADVDDLASILNSMEPECVVHPGETAPPTPTREPPSGTSLYARAGGVYPLALFADRLVDALLADKRVGIPSDGQKRNEASLKYLFTEVVCNAAGGPEVLTATVLTETRLLLPAKKMFFLLDAAKAASDHFDSFGLRIELIKMLSAADDLIIDPARSPPVPPNLQQRREMLQKLGDRTGVPILYVPRGGVVVLDFGAAQEQMDAVRTGLIELGLRSVEKSKVKTAAEAAAGSMLSSAVIAARYTSLGSFVAARKRVHGDPRTLYGRGGGVFGLAKLVDRLMDVWMADAHLNANDMVARWHDSQQKYGFKFLVTQIFGYLTGGPQRYTGQPMDVAHKHLGISLFQWEAFMLGVAKVFREFKIDPATQKDLTGIIASFKEQIVVRDGEAVPADPGLCRKPPSGSSLYAHAGGVYPLAHFVDLLVEKAMDPRGSVRIPFDPTFKRTPPGLKYLVTELVCSGTGGSEVVTSRGFDDAKLGVPVEDWSLFLEMASAAAAIVWPSSTAIQRAAVAVLEESQAELCIGLVAEDAAAPADASRGMLMQAGFGLFEVSAALDRCEGDGQRALELLTSGWTPPPLVVQPAPPSRPAVCPFSGAVAGAGFSSSGSTSGQQAQPSRPAVCPFSGAVAGAGGLGQACPSSSGSGSASGQQAGRVLGDPLQAELDALLLEDPELVCPITLTLLLDPVIASDGCVYERAAVAELARVQGVSPITHAALTGQVLEASEQKAKLRDFMKGRAEDLLGFMARAKKQGKAVMALTACDRAKDYLAALTPDAEPDMAARFVELCRELGRAIPSLSSPHERISKILKEQVARAKAEGETVLQERRAADSTQKSVVFCVDTSGSMRGPRIEKARANILRIFDQHIEDEDHVSLVTFSHRLEPRFELQEVAAGGREKLRMITDGSCSSAGGGTAFWDALASCVDNLKPSPPENQQWIVALTDGLDCHSNRHTMSSARAAIRGAVGSPDLIVIGIQLDAEVKPDLESLCEATEKSIFIDASGDITSLDDAFQQVAEMICE